MQHQSARMADAEHTRSRTDRRSAEPAFETVQRRARGEGKVVPVIIEGTITAVGAVGAVDRQRS